MKGLLQNGRLLTLAIAVLLVAGLGALATLPRTEDPRILNRVATVITPLPGASAERVETLVSEKIENRLRELPEIKHLSSVSRPGISVVRLELKDAVVDTVPVWSRTRDLLGEVADELPAAAGAPELDDDRGYAFTSLVALTWRAGGEPDMVTLGRYGELLRDRMRALPGTDFVELFGEQQEEILVEIDPLRAAAQGLTPAQIAERIRQADAKVAAGSLYNERNQLQIELEGALDSVARIRAVPLTSAADGQLMRVGDLAKVSHALQQPPAEQALIDGSVAVVVGVRMLPDQRVDRWMAALEQRLDEVAAQLPAELEAQILFDQNRYTERRLGDLVGNIVVGFSLIVLVLLVTLGWRPALIVSLSLPLTVLFTLSMMKLWGLPIHQMSVTGLVVALGIMVDNAIVMVDSIQQRRQQGEAALQAVTRSIRHLWLPLLGSTLTTVLAFLPIALMPGPAGEFVGGIALSVIFALLGSWLIAHSLLAALAGRFIRAAAPEGPRWYRDGVRPQRLSRLFAASLQLSLRRPRATLALICLLPLAGFYGAGQLREQFFPPSDRDMFQIEMYLPVQASLAETRRYSHSVSEMLHGVDGIERVQWFLGNSAPSFYYNMMGGQRGAPNYAQAMVNTRDAASANRLIPELQWLLDERLPGAQILVRKLEQGPPFQAPIELRLYGPNLDRLQQLGAEARRILSETPDVIHSRATLQPGTPKVWLDVDEAAGRLSGLTLTGMASQLQGSLNGVTGGTLLEATESIPVRVRVAGDGRRELHDLASLSLVAPGSGELLPLTALAQLELRPSRGAIPRRDGQRVNVIEGYLRAGVLPSTVLQDYSQRLDAAAFRMPPGYSMEFGGEAAGRNDAVGNLLASLGLILALLLTVLVLSFNSFRLSGLIVLVAVQSAGLGLLSLRLLDYPFGFIGIVGLLGLVGLAINAAIVILAELKADPAAVRGDRVAIAAAVQSCARHIVSTTITTVGGFMPLILAGGGLWPPFAVIIAGGTVLTTLLSFYFVPASFLLMSRRHAFDSSAAAEAPLPAAG
ncbi:acriflavin resistance protein [Marinobacterium nitratireducens]|uniref:Acriflavin resistance protein n=1 Tax=Marinobacterium nitratireducens TaxID=518897 RepID=A0A917ZKJ4_9GAMM|nr:efflux RND transporter permease subunit [Marinobacterium nitratireducens]GGO83522.1 acriflavin resistance protein [Marinobacterium nitratireducens]